jgi:hypothetical protein
MVAERTRAGFSSSAQSTATLFPPHSASSLIKFRVEHSTKHEQGTVRVRFGPIYSIRSTVWPIISENFGPMFLREVGTASSFILELWPNIFKNLHVM